MTFDGPGQMSLYIRFQYSDSCKLLSCRKLDADNAPTQVLVYPPKPMGQVQIWDTLTHTHTYMDDTQPYITLQASNIAPQTAMYLTICRLHLSASMCSWQGKAHDRRQEGAAHPLQAGMGVSTWTSSQQSGPAK